MKDMSEHNARATRLIEEGPKGTIRELRITNEALTKRVAELESIVNSRIAGSKRLAERIRAIAEALRDLSPGPHPGPMDAEDYVPLIAKRVAELEGTIRGLLACQEHLQSQLAWTPVAQGLPTEPGTHCIFAQHGSMTHAALTGIGWFSPDGECFMPLRSGHYRRVELPEAT